MSHIISLIIHERDFADLKLPTLRSLLFAGTNFSEMEKYHITVTSFKVVEYQCKSIKWT